MLASYNLHIVRVRVLELLFCISFLSCTGTGTGITIAITSAFSVAPNHKMTSSSQPSQPSQSSPSESESFFSNHPNDEKPLMTFGVIADIQYAPIPDGHSYGGVPRFYRHALTAANHAATHFQNENVALVVNLGDTIDGKCQDADELCNTREKGESEKGESEQIMESESESESSECETILDENVNVVVKKKKKNHGHDAIHDVVDALSAYKGRILHTYGNHELYNLKREEIGETLQIPFVTEPTGDLVGYYHHTSPSCQHVKFVILDSYDITIEQRCAHTSQKRKIAHDILEQNNPNYPQVPNSPEGLEGCMKRFVAFNGGIDEPQLQWLRDTLEQAKNDRQKVIILSHQPILPGSSSPVCLIWNYDQVLDILREYKCTVAAAFAGHAHRGGYKRDELSGIHFRVFEATLESNDPIKTYGFVDVHDDCLIVRGEGECTSATYSLDHMELSLVQ